MVAHNKMQGMRVIATGGTFDKHYDEISGTLGFAACTHLPEMLKRARVTLPYEVELLPLMDSNDMVDADRQRLRQACEKAQESCLVIVHGTDTMVDSAAVIAAAGLNKTIVLTGAMVPYSIAESDALFNLGFAMAVAHTLQAGVYISMNGRCFGWNNVRKNSRLGLFEAVR